MSEIAAPALSVGARVTFAEEARPYRVRAANARFAVCTKRFNLRHTVLYTVVDLREEVRGTENLIFGRGAETDAQCRRMLRRLARGETAVSHRNWVPLTIVGVLPA